MRYYLQKNFFMLLFKCIGKMKGKIRMLKKSKITVLIIVFLLIFLLSIIFAIININSNTIMNGVYINNIDVSKLTKDEAKYKLTELIENKINSNIKIDLNLKDEEKNEIDISTLEVKYDINDAINKAYDIGRKGNIFQNNYEIINTLKNKKDIQLEIHINENNLTKTIDSISSNLPDKLIQTSFYIENKNLIITKGKAGIILKQDNL